MLHNKCGTAAETKKGKAYEIRNGDLWSGGLEEEQNGSSPKEMKQEEDASKGGWSSI